MYILCSRATLCIDMFDLCRHDDYTAVNKVDHSSLLTDDDRDQVFPLKIRLSVSWETNSLLVKIKLKVVFCIYMNLFCFCYDILSTEIESPVNKLHGFQHETCS